MPENRFTAPESRWVQPKPSESTESRWVNPNEGQTIEVGEAPIQEPVDLPDEFEDTTSKRRSVHPSVRSAALMAGGALGGLAGLSGGPMAPATSLAGGAMGAAFASAAMDAYEGAGLVDQLKNAGKEAYDDAVWSATFATGMPIVGGLLSQTLKITDGQGLKAWGNALMGKTKLNNLIIAAQDLEIPVGLLHVSDNKLVKGIPKVTGIFPMGASPARQNLKDAKVALDQTLGGFLETVGPNMTLHRAGVDVTQAARNVGRDHWAVSGHLYDSAYWLAREAGDPAFLPSRDLKAAIAGLQNHGKRPRVTVPGGEVEQSVVRQRFGTEMEETGIRVAREGDIAKYTNQRKNVSGLADIGEKTKTITRDVETEKLTERPVRRFKSGDQWTKDFNEFLEDLKHLPDNISAEELRGLEEDLNRAIRTTGSQAHQYGPIKQAFENIKSDVSSYNLEGIDPDTAKDIVSSMDAANKWYAQMMTVFQGPEANYFKRVDPNIFNSEVVREAGNMHPDQIANVLIRAQSPQSIKSLRGIIGDEPMRGLARSQLNDAAQQPNVRTGPDEFSFRNFETQLGLHTAEGTDTWKELLRGTGVSVDKLKSLVDVGKKIDDIEISDAAAMLARKFTLGGYSPARVATGVALFGFGNQGAAAVTVATMNRLNWAISDPRIVDALVAINTPGISRDQFLSNLGRINKELFREESREGAKRTYADIREESRPIREQIQEQMDKLTIPAFLGL